ncbi:hypothetical protein HYH03_001900 [Edaphochlamys debaryana]|uniref:Uncharacterized protein n=1 Tax=Edaphochlamys debaryana TaxID=47281 RepID=A0A835YEK1_9CHLO|nr:hypothetical protein HYH03_001900 [Edaphochlamys debaryana]|eukprot:KAG2500324.1 hypothetical protein HYH03_001900 [Edaphochlamys debaryana]
MTGTTWRGSLAAFFTTADHSILRVLRGFQFWGQGIPRVQHGGVPAARHRQNATQQRLQQLALGGVLALLVLTLLYFDSGHDPSRRKGGPSIEEQLALAARAADSDASSVEITHVSTDGADQEAKSRDGSEAADPCDLTKLQVCSHRGSLSPNDPGGDESSLVDRIGLLASSGILCYDLDVVTTLDGQLVVGYPTHIVSQLKAGGKVLPPGQGVESVPWADYVAAGLTQRHPPLGDVLKAFAKVVDHQRGGGAAAEGSASGEAAGDPETGAEGATRTTAAAAGGPGDGAAGRAATGAEAGKAQAQEGATGGEQSGGNTTAGAATGSAGAEQGPSAVATQSGATAAAGAAAAADTVAGLTAGGGGKAGDAAGGGGRRRLEEKLRGESTTGADAATTGGGAGTAAAAAVHPAPYGPILFIELKEGAMTVANVRQIVNESRSLGIEHRVALWLMPRSPGSPPATGEALGFLGASGAQTLKVLGLPDVSRLPNGTTHNLSASLDPTDPSTYDMLGPSVKHSDAALAQLGASGLPLVAWTVDDVDQALRVARAGGGLVVSNDPLGLSSRISEAAGGCPTAAGKGEAKGEGVGEGQGAEGRRRLRLRRRQQ